jgi:hypothetical protein
LTALNIEIDGIQSFQTLFVLKKQKKVYGVHNNLLLVGAENVGPVCLYLGFQNILIFN